MLNRKDLFGGEAAESAAVVPEVVPLEIRSPPVPRVVDVIELSWVIGSVLLGLELTFVKRIVVADSRPRVRAGCTELTQGGFQGSCRMKVKITPPCLC